jgi:glycosyltransferase involved in cell wall biosynthesis
MVIGIESERANSTQKTGVEHYAKQLILHLSTIDLQNQYILYVRTKPQAWLLGLPKNFQVKIMPFPIFWTQLRLSIEMWLNPVDLLFIPASSMPLIHPKKTVVTVHDLAFMHFPETYTLFARTFHKFEDWLVSKFAWKIIAVSESTKQDFLKFWKVNPDRIVVVHHGYEVPKPNDLSALTQIQLPEQYVLFLSTLQPRKNLSSLMQAMKELRLEYPELANYKLVVVGKTGWKFEKILEDIARNKDFVVYLNHLSDRERYVAMRQAKVFVLPSFYEGFGMTILEAFALGVPVATSNISSMPEVAGEAAVYFNPAKVSEIKSAISKILFDKSLSDSLIQQGTTRLSLFGWEKCAKETLVVLES